MVYHLDDPLTLQNDQAPHRVAIAALGLEAKLQYICVPREASSVFIEATIKNTSEYELLAGPVSVFMDGGFVTTTPLDVRPLTQYLSRTESGALTGYL